MLPCRINSHCIIFSWPGPQSSLSNAKFTCILDVFSMMVNEIDQLREHCCFLSASRKTMSRPDLENQNSGHYTMTGKWSPTPNVCKSVPRLTVTIDHQRNLIVCPCCETADLLLLANLLQEKFNILGERVQHLSFLYTLNVLLHLLYIKAAPLLLDLQTLYVQISSLMDTVQSFAYLSERDFPEELRITLKRTFNSCQRRSITCHTYICTVHALDEFPSLCQGESQLQHNAPGLKQKKG